MTESKEYRRSFKAYRANEDDFNYPKVDQIFSYKGERSNPKWIMDEPGMSILSGTLATLHITAAASDEYVVECMVKADTSMVKREQHVSFTNGRPHIYYQINFDLVLLFGLTELKAQIAYMENVSTTLGYRLFLKTGSSPCFSPLQGVEKRWVTRSYRTESLVNLTYDI